jgi:SAM-dependent methyltransferase
LALAHQHITLFWALHTTGVVGPGKSRSILEFGEQNWFGDVEPSELAPLIDQLEGDDFLRSLLRDRLNQLLIAPRTVQWHFDVARLFYQVVFGEHAYRAVDLHGTALAEQHDLNLPLPFSDQFDVVTNLGTAEHVFNQHQVFKSAHEKTKPGGVMIHSLPNQGCYDHGFFNYHPTFVFDLSQANRYHIVSLLYWDGTVPPGTLTPIPDRVAYVSLALAKKLSNYSGLFAVLRRPADEAAFTVPRQGYYGNQLPPELSAAGRNWHGERRRF